MKSGKSSDSGDFLVRQAIWKAVLQDFQVRLTFRPLPRPSLSLKANGFQKAGPRPPGCDSGRDRSRVSPVIC